MTTTTTTTMTTDAACYILRRRATDDAGRNLRVEALGVLKAAGWGLDWIERGAMRAMEPYELAAIGK